MSDDETTVEMPPPPERRRLVKLEDMIELRTDFARHRIAMEQRWQAFSDTLFATLATQAAQRVAQPEPAITWTAHVKAGLALAGKYSAYGSLALGVAMEIVRVWRPGLVTPLEAIRKLLFPEGG